MVLLSILTLVIKYDSNKEYLEEWSCAHFYKNLHYVISKEVEKQYPIAKKILFFSSHNKIENILYAEKFSKLPYMFKTKNRT